MNQTEALGKIIIDFTTLHGISISEFARKCEISKSYISYITKNLVGKYGVSNTYLSKIATAMGLTTPDLQNLIEKYSQNIPFDANKEILIKEITAKLNELSEKELKLLQQTILNADIERLEKIYNFLENMK